MKEKGFLKDFWENPEEYLYPAASLVIAFVTLTNIFSRRITWSNASLTQELMTIVFTWVCCLVTVSVLKIDPHTGPNYLTDKFTGTGRKVYRICRLLLCSVNYGIWVIWRAQTVYRQYHYHLLADVLEMPQWTIGVAIPLSAIFSTARMVQCEIKLAKEGG